MTRPQEPAAARLPAAAAAGGRKKTKRDSAARPMSYAEKKKVGQKSEEEKGSATMCRRTFDPGRRMMARLLERLPRAHLFSFL